jgi:hypothetical protein
MLAVYVPRPRKSDRRSTPPRDWNSARNPRKDAHPKVLHIRDRRNYSVF